MTGRRETAPDKAQYKIALYDVKCRFWKTEGGIRRECGKPVVFVIARHENGSLPMRFACADHVDKGMKG